MLESFYTYYIISKNLPGKSFYKPPDSVGSINRSKIYSMVRSFDNN